MSEFNLTNPLMLACDVDTAEQALELAEKLEGRLGAIKIGPRLSVRYGRDLVSRLDEFAPVFVDNKYLDIPSTMEGAVRATFDAGATFTTIHAWAGPEALERLAKVEKELNETRPFKILVVTVLTSFSTDNLPLGFASGPEKISIERYIETLAKQTLQMGLSGLVCSPHEVSLLRKLDKEAFLVTPGVRLPTDAHGDQKRVETPEAAIRSGASALVVGRPIYESNDPVDAADRILASIQLGLTT